MAAASSRFRVRSAALLAGIALVGLLAPLPAAAAITLTVNRTGDAADLKPGNGRCDTSATSGQQCTLRAAIQEANGLAGADTIAFDIGTSGGVKTISPARPLPAITDTVTINGYTQRGASQNTLATGDNAAIKIQLRGVDAGEEANGLRLAAGDSTIKGLAINRFGGSGIRVTGSGNHIAGNFIGTGAGGASDLGNGRAGVRIVGGTNNTIGGTSRAARNILSGNGFEGIAFEGASGNAVQGNYIGTDATGTAALGNFFGIHATHSDDAVVGGTTSGARNVISGNEELGLWVEVGERTVIRGNYVGTAATGMAPLGNDGFGIFLASSPDTIVGGTTAGAGNIVSANGSDGIRLVVSSGAIVQGNKIGTKADGSGDLGNEGTGVNEEAGIPSVGVVIGGAVPGAGNSIAHNRDDGVGIFLGTDITVQGNGIVSNGRNGMFLRGEDATVVGNAIIGNAESGVEVILGGESNSILSNQILGNGKLGIDLSGGTEDANGVTANDTDDPDTGANDLQNFPVLSSALRAANGVTTVTGSLNSTPNREFTIQFFLADTEASNHGEAVILLGGKTITTNSGGDASFTSATAALSPGQEVTATATDTTTGDTSEFALNVVVVPGP